MRIAIRHLPRLIVALSLASLAGCSVLPKAESPDIYRLPSTALPHAEAGAVNWSLRIDTPQADRAVDSVRIAVLPQGDVVSVYQGARWSDRVPTLLRNRLLEAFRDDGRIAALSSDDTSLQADYALNGDLTAFQSEYRNGQPVIVVRYNARLVRNSGMRIVATHRFEISQPVSGTAVPQVVAAFGQASDALANQLVTWTLQQRTELAGAAGHNPPP
ncbi:ABC-type transport auxiliary lipoprotein family protein [Dyella subtropica]|uniref:ABC-type transport auxiliary lipoprotein family protein n=1 Tax=Dyella subtropica TaxID=2992127 RepID=UPI00225512C7|nr:ABC-type transport auxiliary lipoprotein family protein [Dyella subtropica]